MEELTGPRLTARDRAGRDGPTRRTRPVGSGRGAPAVIGLDIGTSGVKGLVAGAAGSIGAARRGYRLDIGADGRVGLDAEVVWRAVRAVIRALGADAGAVGHRVVAVCSGGSGDEAVWVDDRDRAVAPVLMSLDRRSAMEGRNIVEAIGLDAFVETTGLPPSGAYPLPRLLWLRRTAPGLADRVRRLLAWPEFVATRLGVEPIAEPTLAARSAAFDIRRGQWDRALLAAGGLDAALLPRLGPTGAVAGIIPAAVADGIGLGQDVAMVAGGFDQAMATRGAGIDRPGIAHLGTGSWEAITVLTETLRFDLVPLGFSIGPAIDGGGAWSVMASSPGGTVLRWLDGLGRLERPGEGARRAAVRQVLARAAGAPDGPTGVLVLPDLHPSDSAATAGGVVAGLRLDVDAAALARSTLEGIAFDVADELEAVSAAGAAVTEIRVSGGAAAESRWLQLRADVIGTPVTAVEPRDVGAAAAAALAWAAVVGDRSITEALATLVRFGPPVDPRDDHHARYDELRARRSALGVALADAAHETGRDQEVR